MPVRLKEGDKNETGGTGIEVTDNKVINLILRDENNLIQVNEDNEVYTDLQLESGISTSDTFPVGITTGRVLQADGRPVTGTLTCSKTTSGDYTMYLYGDNGKVYVDNGTGTRKIFQEELTAGTGISISSNTISNTGVTSVNGQTGDVTLGGVTGISQISVDSISSGVATVSVVSGTPANGNIIGIFISNSVANTDGIDTIVLNNTNITVYPKINPKSSNQIQNIAAYFYHDEEHNMDMLFKMGEAAYSPII